MNWINVTEEYAASFTPPPEDIPHQTFTIQGQSISVVTRDYHTITALRAAGHDIASYEERYVYPGRFAPMAHQRQSVAFFLDHERAANLSDPGTGKTLASVWAADCLMQVGAVRRVLITSPKSIMLPVWGRELFSTLPRRPYAILQGVRDKKQAMARQTDIQFIVVNHESLHLLEGHLPEVDLVIVDEATKFKEPRARRTQALMRIAEGKRLWLLTGTPAPQAPTDAYTGIRLLKSGRYISFSRFRDKTMVKMSQFTWRARPNAAEIIHKEYQPSIRFRRDECFDLPDQQFIDLEVEPTKQQEKMAKDFIKQAWADLGGQKVTAVNAGVALSKALQVLAGGVYHPTGEDDLVGATAVDSEPLVEAILSIVTETEGPVLVFAPFRISAAVIHAKMLENNLRSEIVTGATADAERTEIFDRVQKGECDVMVAIPQTVSHGLTLTTSNTIIWVAPPFSFETYEQANARIYRKGQTRKTVVYRITQLPLTKALYRRLDERANLQDTILRLMEEKEV